MMVKYISIMNWMSKQIHLRLEIKSCSDIMKEQVTIQATLVDKSYYTQASIPENGFCVYSKIKMGTDSRQDLEYNGTKIIMNSHSKVFIEFHHKYRSNQGISSNTHSKSCTKASQILGFRTECIQNKTFQKTFQKPCTTPLMRL